MHLHCRAISHDFDDPAYVPSGAMLLTIPNGQSTPDARVVFLRCIGACLLCAGACVFSSAAWKYGQYHGARLSPRWLGQIR